MLRGLTITIEQLEPMRVATLSITSASPEIDAINALLKWARPQGLLDGTNRFFGYDNCQPDPNHTYTVWLTVNEAVTGSRPVEVKDFPGGLFVATEVQGVEEIRPAWKELEHWVSRSEYEFGDQPGLEEHLDFDKSPSTWRFKLYLSLKS
jgi:DNA gyrase inhibitor GyrI